MQISKKGKWVAVSFGIFWGAPIYAEVSFDGSLGTPYTLSGSDYDIKAEYGKTQGSNLFHSFRQFNIGAGESATFRSGDGISNIYARVTGGSTSQVNGRLSVDKANTNLWLFNPKGIVFGNGASLDINGAFYTGTANGVRFGENEFFNALPQIGETLSSQSPKGFHFNDGVTGSIVLSEVTFANSNLNRLLIAAPNISIVNSRLQLGNASVEIGMPVFNGIRNVLISGTDIGVDGNMEQRVSIVGDSVDIKKANIHLTGESPISNVIDISAKDLTLKRAVVEIASGANTHPGQIRLDANSIAIGFDSRLATENIVNSDSSIRVQAKDVVSVDASTVKSSVDSGHADIAISAGSINITNAATVHSGTMSGNAGNISVVGNKIVISNGILQSVAETSGSTGNIYVKGPEIQIADNSSVISDARGSALTRGVDINADIAVVKDARISVVGPADENATLRLTAAKSINLSGNVQLETKIVANTGRGADIVITAPSLGLEGGAQIQTQTASNASGGDIKITAATAFTVENVSSTGVIVETAANGAQASSSAGTIAIAAGIVDVQEKTLIRSESFGDNRSGDIAVKASNNLILKNANIASQSQNGESGTILVSAPKGRLENSNVDVQRNGASQPERVKIDIGVSIQANPTAQNPVANAEPVDQFYSIKQDELRGDLAESTTSGTPNIGDTERGSRIRVCSGKGSANNIASVKSIDEWFNTPGSYRVMTGKKQRGGTTSTHSRNAVQSAYFLAGQC